MKNLREKTAEGIQHDEICDILFQLFDRVNSGKPVGNCPEEILLNEDNEIVEIRTSPQDALGTLLFMPPEVISSFATGTRPSVGKLQECFIVGMLAYFMCFGADYYSRNGLSVLEYDWSAGGRQSLLDVGSMGNVLFAESVSLATSFDPERREHGMSQFLSSVPHAVPMRVEIQYLCDGKLVEIEERLLTDDMETQGILVARGRKYQSAAGTAGITYRPGHHRRTVPVVEIGRNERRPTETVKPERFLYVRKAYLAGQADDLSSEQRVMNLNERDSSVTLTLKAAYPACQLRVYLVYSPRQIRLLKEFSIPSPNLRREERYRLRLRYSARENCVTAETVRGNGDRWGEVIRIPL